MPVDPTAAGVCSFAGASRDATIEVILGSTSRARRQLLSHILPLQQDGVKLTFDKPDIDEKAVGSDHRTAYQPRELTLAVAEAKADALVQKLAGSLPDPRRIRLLITSDQVTVWNGQIREKPESKEECRQFLQSYEYLPAQTVSAIVVTELNSGARFSGVDVATQHWKRIPGHVMDQVIEEEDGNIMHCCGGFMIDHELLQPYLAQRIGDADSIMGLPLKLTRKLLEEAFLHAIRISAT